MLRLKCAALPLLVFLAACPPPEFPLSEPEAIRRAQLLAHDDSLPVWPAADAGKPVLLYVDRSQSMRGFLDPDYPTQVRTDYRSVLDGFAARLRPAEVFGFGNEVRATEDADLGVLGNPGFYSDGNTELEEVLARVGADSALDSTHVIIGDGRRGDPNAANRQFVRMRTLAERWTAAGGTFIVAASHAPFKPVASDVSGCRGPAAASPELTDSADSTESAGRATCPLYAFAFVAPGDQARVATALAATFEDLFVTPLPALAPADVRLTGTAQGMTLRNAWTKTARGVPVARVRGPEQTPNPLRARIAVTDTASPRGRAAWAALQGRRLVVQLSVRRLDSIPHPWNPIDQSRGQVRPHPDSLAVDFITYGDKAPPSLYRLDLHPAGDPVWLDAYDADAAADGQRTYGLGRLFEGFQAADPRASSPVLRLYAVVN